MEKTTTEESHARAILEVRSGVMDRISRSPWRDAQGTVERLGKMIAYAIGRVDYYEALRNRYQTIGIALFGGGVALAGLILSFDALPGVANLAAWTGDLAWFGTGFLILKKFNDTSASHLPYRDFADIRSWYYRYTVEEQENAIDSAKQFGAFVSKWADFADVDDRFIAEDLEQVFILYCLQGAKRKAVKEMQDILTYGMAAFGAAALVAVTTLAVAGL